MEAAVYLRELRLVLCAEQRGEMETTGGRAKGENIYGYLWLIEDVIQHKLAQHCKSIIFYISVCVYMCMYIYIYIYIYMSQK